MIYLKYIILTPKIEIYFFIFVAGLVFANHEDDNSVYANEQFNDYNIKSKYDFSNAAKYGIRKSKRAYIQSSPKIKYNYLKGKLKFVLKE